MPDLPNPLHDIHRQAEAEFQPYADLEIVSTFGEPQAEYAAARKGCAMLDLPQRGILELTGQDRLAFLNNLLTNQTWDKQTKTGLAAGRGVYAFYLNLKGRIVCDMNVLEREDRTLLEMDGRMVERVRMEFEKYLFAERVKMIGRVGTLHQIALHGPGAASVLNQALESPLAELKPLDSIAARLFGVDLLIWRDDPAAVAGYHLIVPSESARVVWMNLLAKFSASHETGKRQLPGKRQLRPIGWAAFNAARIEGGRAIFGIDFDESILPAETGQLDRAVSFTKGCYLGQEIVARMHARGQVAKRLCGIKMESDALPIAGTKIFDDQSNEIGGITSSTLSPVLSNVAICLGYVKKPLYAPGSTLIIPAEGKMRKGTVVELPFM